MARIELGIGTSHAPQLSTPPDAWADRAVSDRANPALAFRGDDYTFEQLTALRGDSFAHECAPEVMAERYARCRAAIAELGERVRAAGVDALVIVSSDHKEIFDDELLAPFVVYWGEEVRHEPYTSEQLAALPPGLAMAEAANVPDVGASRRCHPALGRHLVQAIRDSGFDPGASERLPAGKLGNHGIPHGWGFVLQQILGGQNLPPIVPVFVNTFWQPNPPNARRCYAFGEALGAAISTFPEDITVGIVASGGLSHFVIDEDLDQLVLKALEDQDADQLTTLADDLLRAGTSELRNWVVVAGAMAATPLQASVVDYVPCYRSEAGTGCGMGFVTWDPHR